MQTLKVLGVVAGALTVGFAIGSEVTRRKLDSIYTIDGYSGDIPESEGEETDEPESNHHSDESEMTSGMVDPLEKPEKTRPRTNYREYGIREEKKEEEKQNENLKTVTFQGKKYVQQIEPDDFGGTEFVDGDAWTINDYGYDRVTIYFLMGDGISVDMNDNVVPDLDDLTGGKYRELMQTLTGSEEETAFVMNHDRQVIYEIIAEHTTFLEEYGRPYKDDEERTDI